MSVTRRLVTKRERIEAESAARLRQAVLNIELPERLRSELVNKIDRRTAGKREWVFKQMSAEANAEVGRWIRRNAARPLLSFALWHEIAALLSLDNEVLASRRELAELIGTDPGTVTRLMAELEGIGAVRREREGSRVRYFLSERILTTKTGAAREQAQALWPPISSPSPRPAVRTRAQAPDLRLVPG